MEAPRRTGSRERIPKRKMSDEIVVEAKKSKPPIKLPEPKKAIVGGKPVFKPPPRVPTQLLENSPTRPSSSKPFISIKDSSKKVSYDFMSEGPFLELLRNPAASAGVGVHDRLSSGEFDDL